MKTITLESSSDFHTDIRNFEISQSEETGMSDGVKDLCALWTFLSNKPVLDDLTLRRMEFICMLARQVHAVLSRNLLVEEVEDDDREYFLHEEQNDNISIGSSEESGEKVKVTTRHQRIQKLQNEISDDELADSLQNQPFSTAKRKEKTRLCRELEDKVRLFS
jgi:hypothetical protein